MRAAIGVLALLLVLSLASRALAAPPSHPPLADPLGGFALDHACGTAVDSEGDVYVSNAGNDAIEVFDSSGSHLTSIPDAKEPCGLAVDPNGRLYVSEREVGGVVRFDPNAYPFSGTPTYSSPSTIDASGNADGIAADSTDGSLYVAEGNRVVMYNSEGTPGVNELQRIRLDSGSYKLHFGGQETISLEPTSTHEQVKAALEALSTIGPGNVSVSQFPGGGSNDHLIMFKGALGGANVEQITCTPACVSQATQAGSNGIIGEGELTNATGVAVYTYDSPSNLRKRRYISVADPGVGAIKIFFGRFGLSPAGFEPGTLALRQTIDGSGTPAGELGLAATGAYLGADGATGHVFSYDATHKVLDEFEATGQYFTQIADPEFGDAEPTAIAVDRSGGANDGDLLVTAGAGIGAKLLGFGPVKPPTRATLPEPPAHKLNNACGTAVDSEGDVYVASESTIKIYGPAGDELTSIPDPGRPCWLAVDSEGDVYAANIGEATSGDEEVVYYEPGAYPFSGTPTYTQKGPVEALQEPQGVGVDPVTGRVFVTHNGAPGLLEYKSAAEGSGLIQSGFCGATGVSSGVDVYGATGDVYVVSNGVVNVCSADGTKRLAEIDGSGGPGGIGSPSIAVDQSNGHVLLGEMGSRGDVEEFEASGAFVEKFGNFVKAVAFSDVAVDSSGGPTQGRLYVAYRNDLSAFGPLTYGGPPAVVTGTASGLGGGGATLHGTVNPRGTETSECKFEYVTKTAFEATGFSDLSSGGSKSCAENASQIGSGNEPVQVHVEVSSLDPEAAYCFRIVAANPFGPSSGAASCFGAPFATTGTAQPILYREATLHGEVHPSGLPTTYFFEYGTSETYGKSTAPRTLAANAPPTQVEGFLVGLQEGTEYHFRLVAENEAGGTEGADRVFVTQAHRAAEECSNQTSRLENNSTSLPDCRAYELVTPADTRGASPHAEGPGGASMFNNWLTTPSGPLAGDSLAFFLEATLPGAEGNGTRDAYRATRGNTGWDGDLFSPSYVETGEASVAQQGVSPDQLYSFWEFGGATPPEAFPPGHYLRIPNAAATAGCSPHPGSHFEFIGCGGSDTDPEATGRYISAGGEHVIFTSDEQLEPQAPAAGAVAVYDREAEGESAQVVSLLPNDVTPAASATYQGATPDGSSVVFSVGGELYLRRHGTETVEVTGVPATFAGISEDGTRVFYAQAGNIYVFDAEGPTTTEIAPGSTFVAVSADGSHAFYVTGNTLHSWNGSSSAIATLDADDLFEAGKLRFPETGSFERVALDSWTAACVDPTASPGAHGRAFCPVRSTADGNVFVFQSHADLTPPYEGNGHSEIYRYDATDESLLCISCDPSGAPATADADLQGFSIPFPTWSTTLIPSVTEDGRRIFFQTEASLLPEDANAVTDVYEWLGQGTGGCQRAGGCLALISSGQGDRPSYIYSMTPSGHDVFFTTLEKLIPSDVAGSPSIYDARVEGGFAQPVEKEVCHGDACQPLSSGEPERPSVRSDVPSSGNVEEPLPRCPKGRRAVRRKGRVHCVKRHHKPKHRHAKRRAGR